MADGLGDGCVAVRLDRALEMRRVDQPAVDDGFARALAATRREMAGSEVMFDGVIAIPVAVRGHVVDSYEATYAWHLTERGGNLSTGQRQLLAIARVMARDASVVVLDEATASVDSLTERLIDEAVATLFEQRTVIVIAHRLSTIRKADRIIVLHRGQVVEQGTHDQLMAMGGRYKLLVETGFAL